MEAVINRVLKKVDDFQIYEKLIDKYKYLPARLNNNATRKNPHDNPNLFRNMFIYFTKNGHLLIERSFYDIEKSKYYDGTSRIYPVFSSTRGEWYFEGMSSNYEDYWIEPFYNQDVVLDFQLTYERIKEIQSIKIPWKLVQRPNDVSLLLYGVMTVKFDDVKKYFPQWFHELLPKTRNEFMRILCDRPYIAETNGVYVNISTSFFKEPVLLETERDRLREALMRIKEALQ